MSDTRIVTSNSRAPKLWHAVIGDLEFREQHKEIIESLFDGDYNPADLERLHGHRVVRSIRQNIKSRFLLTTFTYNGRHYLLPLESLEDHEYDKSRFLQSGVLEAWVENQMPMLLAQIRELEGKTNSTEEEKPQPFKLTNFDFIGKKIIQFNPDQEEGLAVSLPAIIRGAPGSGKTLLLLKRAKEFAQNPDPNKRVLFYTDHPYLIEDVKKLWDLPNETRIEFRSKQELIEEQDPSLKDAIFVGDKEFSVWMDNHVKGYEGQCKARREKITQDLRKFLDDRKGLYLALQQIAANLAFNQVEVDEKLKWEQIAEKGFNGGETLGQYDERQRKFLAEAFISYDKSLKQVDRNTRKRKFDPKLQKFNVSKRFDLVLVDEYQDSSRLELAETWQLAKTRGDVCYAGDQLQNLTEQESQLKFLQNVMHKDKQSETIVMLPFTFRCPEVSVSVINAFIKFLYNVSGGKSDKHQQTSVKVAEQKVASSAEQSKGNFVWLDDTSSQELKDFISANEKSIYVVIVPEKADKEELRKLYRGATLLTVREIKGREYDNVIVHNPFADDTKLVVEACKKFDPSTAGQQTNLPKNGAGDNTYNQMVHKWIVNVSRNLKNCIFVQPTNHQTKQLKQFVLQEAGLLHTETKIDKTVCIATPEQVEAEVRGLLLSDKEDEALNQWLTKLGRTQRDFDKFKKTVLKHESEKIVTKATTPTPNVTSTAPTPSPSGSSTVPTRTQSGTSTAPTLSVSSTARSIPPSLDVASTPTRNTAQKSKQANKEPSLKTPPEKKPVQMTDKQIADDLVKNYSVLKLRQMLINNNAQNIMFDIPINAIGNSVFDHIYMYHRSDFFDALLEDIRFGNNIALRIFNGSKNEAEPGQFFWKLIVMALMYEEAVSIRPQAMASEQQEQIKQILIGMLLKFPIDSDQFTKILLSKFKHVDNPACKYSNFYFLASYMTGNELLDCFFYLYPEQIQKLPLECFTENNCELLKLMAYRSSNHLTLIIERFPELAEKLRAEDLVNESSIQLSKVYKGIRDYPGKPNVQKFSLLDALIYHDGINILIKLLKANNNLKNAVTIAVLNRVSKYSGYEGFTLLTLLSRSENGRELLAFLGVPLDDETKSRNTANIIIENKRALKNITLVCTSPEANPEYVFAKRVSRFARLQYTHNAYTSIMNLLRNSEATERNLFVSTVRKDDRSCDPCYALINLFTTQPELNVSFPHDLLLKPHSKCKDAKLDNGISQETLLGALTFTTTGILLIYRLMIGFPNRFNPAELAKTLCLFHKDDSGKIYSPLMHLVSNKIPHRASGFKDLLKFCARELVAAMSEEYLFKHKSFATLALSPEAHDLLLLVFTCKPELKTLVSSNLFNAVREPLQGTSAGRTLTGLLTNVEEKVVRVSDHSIFPPRPITPTSTSSSTPSPHLPMPSVAIPALNLDTRPSLVRPAPSETSQSSITTKI